MHHADLLSQLAQERHRDRVAAASAHRLVSTVPARTRLADTLRRAADRLDAASVSPHTPPVRSALPGGGC
jgi:hypothetical protein